jgi:hypothetical protein
MLLYLLSLSLAHAQRPLPPIGAGAPAAYSLLERLYPGASSAFTFSLGARCPTSSSCFTLSDAPNGTIAISGTTTGELTFGLGHYLRTYVNVTYGWPRGGGSRLPALPAWPRVGLAITRPRLAPWSFAMNVCTHSYTLVWHSWPQWEQFIDYLALWGINLVYGVTGQEEVQYKVFSSLGLDDTTIRSWFNGPAYLTWSRGQNSHGSSVGGPLPRSWMRAQWELQRLILSRERELGIVGSLPAFQGVVPAPLAAALNDSNITVQPAFYGPVATGWLDAADPTGAWGRVADAWMAALCADFGCSDHVYQMDGVFHGASSWGGGGGGSVAPSSNCTFGPPLANAYLAGCTSAPPCAHAPSLASAQAACIADARCSGVTLEDGLYQLRAGAVPQVHAGETSWVLAAGCHSPPAIDPGYYLRGKAAYAGIARTDPNATWLWQGWALNVMSRGSKAAVVAEFRGFATAPPPGHFLVADMGIHGSDPQWAEWGTGDVPFLFTALETFGGNLAIKGNLSKLGAALPWAALEGNASGLWGVGYTPEGFDQNPPVYELIAGASFAAAPLPAGGAAAWLVDRAQRRYGLAAPHPAVTAAWTALAGSGYNLDLGVQDGTSVGKFTAAPFALDETFWKASGAPTAALCGVWTAWGALIEAGQDAALDSAAAPFTYDLVNAGREVLAQLSGPTALNFSRALAAKPLALERLSATGGAYAALLRTLDGLLATDAAFMLGPWVASARAWGANATDCGGGVRGALSCPDFYEWNARAQLTTWYPPLNRTLAGAIARDGDYARKHWAGLVGGFYATRVDAALGVALRNAAAGVPLNNTALQEALAEHAWDWVTATDPLPIAPAGDPVQVAAAARQQVATFFAECK